MKPSNWRKRFWSAGSPVYGPRFQTFSTPSDSKRKGKPMPKAISYQDMYGGEYIGPDDIAIGQSVTYEFTKVTAREVFVPQMQQKITRAVISLAGQKKLLCVNKTSAKNLK